jgi:apolipoprotein N-acyltransferase
MKTFCAIVPAVVSGLLLWLAFFPFDWGPVAFFALGPMLTLVRHPSLNRWQRYGAAYLGGFTFFFLAVNWLRVAHPMMAMAWVFLSLYSALTWPFVILVLRRMDRLGQRWTFFGLPFLSLTTPFAWVVFEYLRAHFPTGFPLLKAIGLYHPIGFPWYFLGHTQHSLLAMIQVSDVTGAYGVSFAVAATNGAVAEWLMRLHLSRVWFLGWPRLERLHGWTREFLAMAVAAGIIALPLCYGFFAIVHRPYERGPRVAAIQASISQDEKDGDLANVFRRYDQLCRTAGPKADLVIWPETCFPAGWYGLRDNATWDNAPELMKKNAVLVRGRVRELMTDPRTGWRVPVLLGSSGYDWNGKNEIRTNSAVLIDREGEEAGRYDKIHLVPFGEYVPLVRLLPFLQRFTPYDESYSNEPGQRHSRFTFGVGDRQYTFGTVICYEDSDPAMCHPYVTGSDWPVDFLVNISNDGWFNGTEQHEQHLAICRFRAVELRRSIIRAVNMGISGVIDPDGRVIALPGDDWAKSKKMDGVVSDRIPLTDRRSLYPRIGDFFAILCLMTVVFALVLTRRTDIRPSNP